MLAWLVLLAFTASTAARAEVGASVLLVITNSENQIVNWRFHPNWMGQLLCLLCPCLLRILS